MRLCWLWRFGRGVGGGCDLREETLLMLDDGFWMADSSDSAASNSAAGSLARNSPYTTSQSLSAASLSLV